MQEPYHYLDNISGSGFIFNARCKCGRRDGQRGRERKRNEV